MKVAIYGNQFNKEFNSSINELLDRLNHYNVDIYIYKPFYEFIKNNVNNRLKVRDTFIKHTDIRDEADVMFSIGGDGTFLETVRFVRNYNIPLIGINTGKLGFLANISRDEISYSVDSLINREFSLEERALVKLETSNNLFGELNYGLNEFTVHKRDSGSMIIISAYIDDDYLNTYWADGLIISTPTGSTAYSLSVGGPIVIPNSNNFIIVPISPHNLTVRPIVVPDNISLKLKVDGRGANFLVTLDHRSEVIDSSIELIIKRADFNISLIKFDKHTFYSTLRNKLMWGIDKRN